jgi:hypothetical protein
MVPIIFKKTSKTELLPVSSVADPDPNPVLRIHIFLGLLDPDPETIGQRYGSGSGSESFYHQAKKVRKTLISTAL